MTAAVRLDLAAGTAGPDVAPRSGVTGRGPARTGRPGTRPVADADLVWVHPGYDDADWTELATLLAAGGRLPEPEHTGDEVTLALPTELAQRRALVLLFAHGVAAGTREVVGVGRRAVVTHLVTLAPAEYARVRGLLESAWRRTSAGAGWLAGRSDAARWAQAHWRGLLLAGSWVRTRDSSLILRVADGRQGQAAVASAAALGVAAHRETARREARVRIVIAPQDAAPFREALAGD